MSVLLPLANTRRCLARILVADQFNLGVGPWRILPMWKKGRKKYGYELLSCSRACLPAVGEAKFQFHYGLIDGDLVGVVNATDGQPWDPDSDTAIAEDLRGKEVRIQLAPYVAGGTTPAWRTEWWGQCEYQIDQDLPGANYPAGTRTYHCVDGFFRAKRWPLNRHSVYLNAMNYVDTAGHPGYNVGGDGLTRGNNSTSAATSAPLAQISNPALVELRTLGDVKYLAHQPQGSAGATTWSDLQAAEHAVRITRGVGDPVFNFSGTTTLLSTGTTAWRVDESENAWDFIANRICKRERGRGVVFVDWDDDSGDPTGTLTVKLTINPQTAEDITYTSQLSPTVASSTISGATTAATTVAVDLIGDHRNVADAFKLGGRDIQRFDSVESVGERIQVLVTLSYFDGLDLSLSKRWDSSTEATFAALTAANRIDEGWRPLWQLHGLPYDWRGFAANHNGGPQIPCDFRCNDDGGLATTLDRQNPLTSPVVTGILNDLPLLEGYDYSTVPPTRKIGGSEAGRPSRRPPLVLIRVASDRYLPGEKLLRPVNLSISDDAIMVYNGSDQDKGTRIIGNSSTASLLSAYNLERLGVTVGLEMPHRVRFRTTRSGLTESQVRRKLVLPHAGLHLWLAHSGAIWDLDGTTRNAQGYSPKRSAAGASGQQPGLIRDDRTALAFLHALACSWYLADRQTASWTLRASGFLPSFNTVTDQATQSTTTVTYPTIGKLVTTLTAGGQAHTINTPITAVSYDHVSESTTWETDWQSLDFKRNG